jgi:hypothetical protein
MRMGPISGNHFHGFHSAAFWAITVQNAPEPKVLLSADFFHRAGRFGSVMQTGSEPLNEAELSSSSSAAPFFVFSPPYWAADLASIEPEIGTASCCLKLKSGTISGARHEGGQSLHTPLARCILLQTLVLLLTAYPFRPRRQLNLEGLIGYGVSVDFSISPFDNNLRRRLECVKVIVGSAF